MHLIPYPLTSSRVFSNQIKRIQSLHNVTWDPSMEPALRALETNIINTILPVREKLHKKWKRMSPTDSELGSGASSVSLSSVSSSTKTSKEDAVLDTPSSSAATGTSIAGTSTNQSVGKNDEFCHLARPAGVSNKANKTVKPSKTKTKKGIQYHLL